MKRLQVTLFVAYFCLMMIILGGTIFSVMVEYPNWFANVPASLDATRNFYKVLHPGYFFQTMAPLFLLAGLGFLIAGWRTSARNLVLISVLVMVAAELLTFLYIYPRLNILFANESATQAVEVLKQAAREFTTADQIRTGLGVVASGLSIAAMLRFFKTLHSSNA